MSFRLSILSTGTISLLWTHFGHFFLIDKGVTVCEKENVLRLIGTEKNINRGHGYARLARWP